MFTRTKLTENADPHSQVIGPRKGVSDFPGKGVEANIRKPAISQTRRAAFGDVTNATKEQNLENDMKRTIRTRKLNNRGKMTMPWKKTSQPLARKKMETRKELDTLSNNSRSFLSTSDQVSCSKECPFSSSKQALGNLTSGLAADRGEEDISVIIVEDCDDAETASSRSEDELETETSLLTVDQENYMDVFNVGMYAQHIFDYYKCREKMFPIPAYMSGNQCRITPVMRAILVDWLVEIQENFELNHETLYLAVKLTDMYLSRVSVNKDILQLIGAASVFIASKFDERCPPLIDDFIYICDSAFDRDRFISMEMEILKTVEFDLGIPISYRFLRRYAKVARMSMKTLTLARYILEMSLMEYDLVVSRDSMVAAAALYVAQKMGSEGAWEGDVVKSSGYTFQDIKELVVTLNKMLLARPTPQLSTIRSKYSHEIFHEVAKIVPLRTEDLL